MAAGEARRTRIVATIGPASASEDVLRAMIAAGMDAARLNFSHAAHEWHGNVIRRIRQLAGEADRPIAVIGDLQGPRIRTGALAGGSTVELEAGQPLTLTTENVPGSARRLSTTYVNLPADVGPGMTILIADGLIQLVVREVRDPEIECEVVVGGALGQHKGINVPEASISAPAITEKDRADLAFICEQGFDYAGLSFVRSGDDVRRARELAATTGRPPLIIGKIERREAVANLAEILAEADGVMVARGDLGVETSSADVPILQKRIIEESNRALKLDITATQMLASMVDNPRPTRAEAADVANAIFDGTDAIMLSEETAVGRYPVKSVETMDAIARRAEENIERYGRCLPGAAAGPTTTAATAHAACLAADELGARAIIVFTMSGRTARIIAGRRPRTPIIAATPDETTWRALALVWGVTPFRIPVAQDAAGMFASMEEELLARGVLERGDLVVATVGATTVEGATNVMKIHVIGDVGGPSPRP